MIDKLSGFIADQSPRQAFLLKGYAGTGKTTVIAALVKTLKAFRKKTVLLAPTGRSAKVLSQHAATPAFTIHKKIYRQKTFDSGFGKFDLNANLSKNTCYIVDEVSLLSNRNSGDSAFGTGCLLDDLVSYVYSDPESKLILVGDTAQLPPVGMNESPAMVEAILEGYGLNVSSFELRQVVRQAEESGILQNATRLRHIISSGQALYPSLDAISFPDVEVVSGMDLIETLSDAYSKYGREETMVVCRSNKMANRFNQGIRSRVLFMEEEFSAGDYVMIVKNNYHWVSENENLDFLANGDIARIRRIRKYEERYGFRFLHVDMELPDYDDYEISCILLLDTINQESPSLSQEDNKRLYDAVSQDYADIKQTRKRAAAVREDPYFNAIQVKFAYAVTCHKSQGGQWRAVFVQQGWFTEDMLTVEYLRWLYTAFTRAVDKLYLVNFDSRFLTD